MKKLILIELNEINFDIVRGYIELGHDLPAFSGMFKAGLCRTRSEDTYSEVEPWIQWVSVHTGKEYLEHKVFRLGDMVDSDVPQVFEKIERMGYSICAISPMNAVNRLSDRDKNLFVPDPWTRTTPTSQRLARFLTSALTQTVNDNSKGRIEFKSVCALFYLAFTSVSFVKLFSLIPLAFASVSKKWYKSIFLDVFIASIFDKYIDRHRPDFASIFLNAGAHIQHHYLLNSAGIDKPSFINPTWYLSHKDDPLLDLIKAYDSLLCSIFAKKGYRFVLATGLTQVPFETPSFYYRLRNHNEFFTDLGMSFVGIEPRMTRDFLTTFENNEQRDLFLEEMNLLTIKGIKLFGHYEKRDLGLFVTLNYKIEIPSDAMLDLNPDFGLYAHLVFVAIKNGGHDGGGWAYTDIPGSERFVDEEHVSRIHDLVLEYFS